jgi:hypothetical protein
MRFRLSGPSSSAPRCAAAPWALFVRSTGIVIILEGLVCLYVCPLCASCSQVYSAALSPIMSTHTLIAVASEERRVRLCDLTSGGGKGHCHLIHTFLPFSTSST